MCDEEAQCLKWRCYVTGFVLIQCTNIEHLPAQHSVVLWKWTCTSFLNPQSRAAGCPWANLARGGGVILGSNPEGHSRESLGGLGVTGQHMLANSKGRLYLPCHPPCRVTGRDWIFLLIDVQGGCVFGRWRGLSWGGIPQHIEVWWSCMRGAICCYKT